MSFDFRVLQIILKPYECPILGCICGYSRKIIWLEVDRSNNNPKIQSKVLRGCYPECWRPSNDCMIRLWKWKCVKFAAMWSYFWTDGADEFAGCKAQQYGSSPSNQRLEGRCNFQMECLWFCFARIIKKELDSGGDHWNNHNILEGHTKIQSLGCPTSCITQQKAWGQSIVL